MRKSAIFLALLLILTGCEEDKYPNAKTGQVVKVAGDCYAIPFTVDGFDYILIKTGDSHGGWNIAVCPKGIAERVAP